MRSLSGDRLYLWITQTAAKISGQTVGASLALFVLIVSGWRAVSLQQQAALAGQGFVRVGFFAFRTLAVFDARAVFIALSAALILASRVMSPAGKFKAKFSLVSARSKKTVFLFSEIGCPMAPHTGK
jgi:hypothetical protein